MILAMFFKLLFVDAIYPCEEVENLIKQTITKWATLIFGSASQLRSLFLGQSFFPWIANGASAKVLAWKKKKQGF